MTSVDSIMYLFCRVDDSLEDGVKHPQAKLYPSEVVTLALLYALKGCDQRAFWRWLTRGYRELFPHLPHLPPRTRLFNSHQHYVEAFLAEPTLLGVIDSYGIEPIHPTREGRSESQIGKKGKSNHRWIVGGKLCFLLNHLGLVVSFDCDTANVYDGSAFQELVDAVADTTVVFSDMAFEKKDWHPTNLRVCLTSGAILCIIYYVTHTMHNRKGGGSMRFSRELLKGSTVTVVLSALAEQPMYGYRLVKHIEARSDGVFKFSQGTLYPLLYNLERKGLVQSKWDAEGGQRPRKYYSLTPKGTKTLAENRQEWWAFARGMEMALGGKDA